MSFNGDADVHVPLTGPEIIARIARAGGGAGSGFDADTIRGRALPTDVFRFDLAPQFLSPPMYLETVTLALFGA